MKILLIIFKKGFKFRTFTWSRLFSQFCYGIFTFSIDGCLKQTINLSCTSYINKTKEILEIFPHMLSALTSGWSHRDLGGGLVISLIFGREVVKIEGACFLVSRVSGATHHTATDTPGACCGREDREERRGKRRRRQKR